MDSASALGRLAAGDQEAWAWLVDRHGPDMLRVCQRLLADQAALDALQDSLLKLRATAGRFAADGAGEVAARAWIMTLTWRTAHNLARSGRRRRHHERIAGVASPIAAAEEAAGDDERLEPVRRALRELKPAWRQAIELHVIEQLPHAAIAEALGCSPEAVRLRVSKGLRSLRQRLERQGLPLGAATLLALLASPQLHASAAWTPQLAAQCHALATHSLVAPATLSLGGWIMTLSVCSLAGLVLAISVAAVEETAAEAQPEPPPAVQPEVAVLAMSDRQVTIDLPGTRIEQFVAFMHDVLGYPIRLDPAVELETLPPLTMQLTGVKLLNMLEFVMLQTGLRYRRDQDGNFVIQPRGPRGDAPVVQPERRLLMGAPLTPEADAARLVIEPGTLLELAERHGGGRELHPAVHRALSAFEGRLAIAVDRPGDEYGWNRRELQFAALSGMIRPAPFHALSQTVDVAYAQQDMHAILADLSRRSGLPMRIGGGLDGHDLYGVLPLISLDSERITVGAVLDLLATHCHLLIAEGGDGSVVLYEHTGTRGAMERRAERLAELPAELAAARERAAEDPQAADRADRLAAQLEQLREPDPRITAFQRARSGVHLQLSPAADLRIGSVDLHDATPEAVRNQLAAVYGVELELRVKQGREPAPVTLLMEDRPLRDVLTVLQFFEGFTLALPPEQRRSAVEELPLAPQ